jgi:hypothetical protein
MLKSGQKNVMDESLERLSTSTTDETQNEASAITVANWSNKKNCVTTVSVKVQPIP